MHFKHFMWVILMASTLHAADTTPDAQPSLEEVPEQTFSLSDFFHKTKSILVWPFRSSPEEKSRSALKAGICVACTVGGEQLLEKQGILPEHLLMDTFAASKNFVYGCGTFTKLLCGPLARVCIEEVTPHCQYALENKAQTFGVAATVFGTTLFSVFAAKHCKNIFRSKNTNSAQETVVPHDQKFQNIQHQLQQMNGMLTTLIQQDRSLPTEVIEQLQHELGQVKEELKGKISVNQLIGNLQNTLPKEHTEE